MDHSTPSIATEYIMSQDTVPGIYQTAFGTTISKSEAWATSLGLQNVSDAAARLLSTLRTSSSIDPTFDLQHAYYDWSEELARVTAEHGVRAFYTKLSDAELLANNSVSDQAQWSSKEAHSLWRGMHRKSNAEEPAPDAVAHALGLLKEEVEDDETDWVDQCNPLAGDVARSYLHTVGSQGPEAIASHLGMLATLKADHSIVSLYV